MELTVYRQSSKTRPDGTIVYKGEDARPYVDEQIFFVADGLGGAAAIRHQKIVPDLFESEKILDTLFKGVYQDYRNEVFAKYVTASFYELFAVKDCYTDNINNIKKSGYFASRIVTAIVLHEMLYNNDYKAEIIFEKLSECENEDSKKAYLNTIGSHFKQLIQAKIKQIAQNANLIYESSYSGLALLGSTLCATLYREHEDCVEAIYLTAGDSRPYIWTERNGLCQILEDQEGKDGGMTNYIKANDDADFDIRCDYFCFEKPCVLFNASDGCFDSGKFISQMAFEKTILEGAIFAESPEKLSEYLTEFFLEYGRHDDSSTIAMKLFGYESFDLFKAACVNRLNRLQTEYVDKMSDLLDVDYISAYEECERTFPSQLAEIKDKFSSEQGVIEYCSNAVKAGMYKPYQDQICAIDKKISLERQRIREANDDIIYVITSNYIKFKRLIKDVSSEKGIIKAEDRFKQAVLEYKEYIQGYKTEFEKTGSALTALFDSIFQIGVPFSFDDFNSLELASIKDCKKAIGKLFDFFSDFRFKKTDVVKKLERRREEYVRKNKGLAYIPKEKDNRKLLFDMVVSGELDISSMELLEKEKEKINRAIEAIHDAEATINKLENEDKKNVLEESCAAYWESEYISIIHAIMDNPKSLVDANLAQEARRIISEFEKKNKSIKESCELQKALFKQYDETYCMYLGEKR